MRTILSAAALLFCLAAGALALAPGERLPALELKTAKGTPFDMTALAGRVIYLDFWASWCGPCKESFPFMESLQKEFSAQGLEVLAVSLDRKPAAAASFLASRPVSFSLAYDAKGQSAGTCGVTGMPTCVLVDRKGVVHTVHTGFRSGDTKTLHDEVKALLAEGK